jgi:hypothetical protein
MVVFTAAGGFKLEYTLNITALEALHSMDVCSTCRIVSSALA